MPHSGNELINPFKVLERAGLRPEWQVADLGCGALGHFVFPAAQMVGGNGKVYAVDILKTALKAIERTAKHEQFWNVFPVWADTEVLHATRIPSDSLDLVILANNLYLSKNREGMVKEAARLIKSGGLLLFIEWKKERTVLGPSLEHRMSLKEAQSYFPATHFAEIDQFDAGDHHFALVYRKHESENVPHVVSVSRSV